MQAIVKNAANAVDRSIVVDAQSLAGAAVNISAATLKTGSTIVAEADFTGTIVQRGSSTTHIITFTQAQSNSFGIGEVAYVRIPGSTGAVESTYPILVLESRVADAPPTIIDANIEQINNVPITGNGTGLTKFGV